MTKLCRIIRWRWRWRRARGRVYYSWSGPCDGYDCSALVARSVREVLG